MIQQQAYIINSILMVADALCIIAAGYSAYFLRGFMSPTFFNYDWSMNMTVFVGSVLAVMFFNNYIMSRLDLYGDSRPSSYIWLLWAIFRAVVVDFAILSAGIFLLKIQLYSRLFLGLFAGQCFLFIAPMRIIAQLYFDRVSKGGFNTRKILIVGDEARGRLVSDVLKKQMSWGHEVIGRLSVRPEKTAAPDILGSRKDLFQILQKHPVDEIIFAVGGDRDIDLLKDIDICRKTGVSTRILPSLWQDTDGDLLIETIQNVPFLTIATDRFNAVSLFYKRLLDLVGSIIGMLILGLLYPFVAVAIKLDSKGPVIFKQKRAGQHGRIFNLYKFRSMRHNAEAMKPVLAERNIMQGAVFKIEDDPRITRVGKWLRKTSLDELPQFFNVLKGEMSLVGTRPPTIEEIKAYQMPQLRRIAAKPGITGLWQVSGRNKLTDFNKIVELDCKYLDQWTFLGDIKILLKTVIVLLQRKGAM